MKSKFGIWLLLIAQTFAIMDSELHYVSKEQKSRLSNIIPSFSTSLFFERNPCFYLFIQHFYMKKSSAFSSASDNKIFYEKSNGPHGSLIYLSPTLSQNIFTIQPSLSLQEEEEKKGKKNENFKHQDEKESKLPQGSKMNTLLQDESESKGNELLTTTNSQSIALSSSNQKDTKEEEGGDSIKNRTLENPSTGIPEEVVAVVEQLEQTEGDDILNSTEIEVPNVENKTEDIPSFREWTQKALEKEEKERKEVKDKKKQLQNQMVVHPHKIRVERRMEAPHLLLLPLPPPHPNCLLHPSRLFDLKKNYVSVDCGAKIVGTNPESTGANYIISSSRDEYMLNKCSDKVWFVIELCESIKARRIEIANFELYSSVPNEFRVSLSNVYPSRDWTHFGTFKAQDSRDVQVFDTLEDNIFGKYVKVEVYSHHGSEHYCPISLFKIFGISEIELMAHGDEEDEDEVVVHPPPEPEEEESNQTKPRGKSSIVSFIKEKVDETIGRVVNVFQSKESKDSNNQINNPELNTKKNYPVEQHQLTSVNAFHCPHCNGTLFQEFLTAFACERFGFRSLASSSLNTTCTIGSSLYGLYSSVYGTGRMIALCNIAYFENTHLSINDTKGVDESDEMGRTRIESNNTESPPSNSLNKDDKSDKSNVNDILPSKVKKDNSDLEDSELNHSSSSSSINSEPISSSSQPSPTILDPPSVVHVPPPASSMVNSVGQEDAEQKTNNNGANTASQRESVWQKLTNRIKSLERNVTFSSGYLEELSVQYKKQIEDLQLSKRRREKKIRISNFGAFIYIIHFVREGGIFYFMDFWSSCNVHYFGNPCGRNPLEEEKNSLSSIAHHEKENMQIQHEKKDDNEESLPSPCDESIPIEGRHSFDNGPLSSTPSSYLSTACKVRRSIDFMTLKASSQLIQSQLTRRQRRRIQQNQRRKISASSKLKRGFAPLPPPYSKDEKLMPEIRVENIFSHMLTSIQTDNKFGSLNLSVHGDPTPFKELSSSSSSANKNKVKITM
ncbi:SUN domain-containing protein 2,Uncharacterized protein SLP1,Uncharacterized protein slp1 [Lepeophtheirus salmonis]|uniref:SUN domain-containing protein 2,Uncharacterized protein SLP1,Uncharacterized protein slp1 n=2 Tax=Lepeophtheirus salmonis TaxID=72036 RepID=A0A7R8CC31_LEPSM|nr:SUN domain-containing protein 2,Uncharacterized protein SLP1,Uncharacterized protein slp1 [Lepeophtheirus salmonis]CAF2766666.1 SUN domain-containing protein 2,Uncharacterized protein SLP1,Uncharacterized protein slp1 [Lepeophtheirus salmonis]